MKRTPLPRRKTPPPKATKPIRKSRYRSQVRVGKLGIVRLRGKALKELRRQCFERDRFRCVDCGYLVAFDQESSLEMNIPVVGHMSHVRAKRNNGDTLDNVVTRCPLCHLKSHNCGGKPVPKKERL